MIVSARRVGEECVKKRHTRIEVQLHGITLIYADAISNVIALRSFRSRVTLRLF